MAALDKTGAVVSLGNSVSHGGQTWTVAEIRDPPAALQPSPDVANSSADLRLVPAGGTGPGPWVSARAVVKV